MKKAFCSLFAVVAATALCALNAVAQSEKPEPNQSARVLTTNSLTYRDPNIVTADLKHWIPPARAWLDAKASDIDPLFMRAPVCKLDIHVDGNSKLAHGGGSDGITSDANGGGNSCIDQLKSGRFVEGGHYVAGAQSETIPWGKNLSG